jgi:phenylalanyl-tRNA synthetase beta chain
MRSSLIAGLLDNIAHNASHKQTRVRVFELGGVFARDTSVPDGALTVAGVHQPQCLAGAAWGPVVEEQWGVPVRQVDFFDVKRDVEALLGVQAKDLVCVPAQHPALHPGRSARLELAGKPIGWIGEVHPRWTQEQDLAHAPVVFELDAASISTIPLPAPREISRQPVVIRDLAIWAGADVSFQDLFNTLTHAIESNATLGIVKDIKLFDVWRDKSVQTSEKSMAFRFWLQSNETTLDDATVEQCMARLLESLVSAHGVRQRA